ncbi:hypothetical protein GQ53DRAFT_784829 [Thozetella sp. PMI_491]|nr:hypothetical protein GQ53DRAFT_784829 [Thozetella sp. PMI_491]
MYAEKAAIDEQVGRPARIFQNSDLSATFPLKSREIILALEVYLSSSSFGIGHSYACPTTRTALLNTLFSPSSLERCLVAFWSFWYPNWPVFHRPTFDEVRAAPSLLASMALIGACLTSRESDHQYASLLVDIVENWVFSATAFSEDLIDLTLEEDEYASQVSARLDAIRAAYCIALIQTWEGDEGQKRRTRRTRYSEIISVARSLCVTGVTHGDLGRYAEAGAVHKNWERFILKEELIRTLTFVFLLDTGYIIFNNMPPRMVLDELNFGLTCPEPVWQASNADLWLLNIKAWSDTIIGQCQPILMDTVKALTKQPSAQEWKILKQMSVLNYFATVSALHILIFQFHCCQLPRGETKTIRNGLENWKEAWLNKENLGLLTEPEPALLQHAWRRIGFARHTFEYWCLGYIIYKYADNMRSLRDSDSFSARGSTKKGFLERYDSSDMGQVHELILKLQTFGLGPLNA